MKETDCVTDIYIMCLPLQAVNKQDRQYTYEGWNFNSGNYLFTTDTK